MSTTTTSKKEEEGRKVKKDEEREVPDPWESIEDTPTVHFHLVSSKSDFREPSFVLSDIETRVSLSPRLGTQCPWSRSRVQHHITHAHTHTVVVAQNSAP